MSTIIITCILIGFITLAIRQMRKGSACNEGCDRCLHCTKAKHNIKKA